MVFNNVREGLARGTNKSKGDIDGSFFLEEKHDGLPFGLSFDRCDQPTVV